jgi:hypothetical protein
MVFILLPTLSIAFTFIFDLLLPQLRKTYRSSASEIPFKIPVNESRKSISSEISRPISALFTFPTDRSQKERYQGNKVDAGAASTDCA